MTAQFVKLTPKEQKHIDELGDAFTRALGRATMSVRSCSKLVGLDKVRAPIAMKAALAATGYDVGPFVLPASAGEITEDVEKLAQELYEDAVKAAL